VTLVLGDVVVLETPDVLGLTVVDLSPPRPDCVKVAAVFKVGSTAGAVVETVDSTREVCALEAAGCVSEICCVGVVMVSEPDVLGSGVACEVDTAAGVWLAADCVSEICCVGVVSVTELNMLGLRGACPAGTSSIISTTVPASVPTVVATIATR